jgi:Activator of Hsp90 ATPase homolog 1-like protein
MSTSPSFSMSFTVERTPEEVFAAVNDVRGWWSGDIEGDTADLGDEFTYRHEDVHYSKQRITESIPGERVVWHVLDGYLGFVEDKTEWTGTEIVFEITRQGDATVLRFTHVGLLPAYECFDNCSSAWSFYINSSLRNLIASSEEQPNRSTQEVQP